MSSEPTPAPSTRRAYLVHAGPSSTDSLTTPNRMSLTTCRPFPRPTCRPHPSLRPAADQIHSGRLYKHVADKDELLDGMVDTVIAEFDPPDPGLDWKSGIRQRILAARRAVLRHPWARQAIESRTNRTPAVLGYMDSV